MKVKEQDNVDLQDPYPWLPDTDIRKRMTDNQILDKFVNLDKSILTEKEKEIFCKIFAQTQESIFVERQNRNMSRSFGTLGIEQ